MPPPVSENGVPPGLPVTEAAATPNALVEDPPQRVPLPPAVNRARYGSTEPWRQRTSQAHRPSSRQNATLLSLHVVWRRSFAKIRPNALQPTFRGQEPCQTNYPLNLSGKLYLSARAYEDCSPPDSVVASPHGIGALRLCSNWGGQCRLCGSTNSPRSGESRGNYRWFQRFRRALYSPGMHAFQDADLQR